MGAVRGNQAAHAPLGAPCGIITGAQAFCGGGIQFGAGLFGQQFQSVLNLTAQKGHNLHQDAGGVVLTGGKGCDLQPCGLVQRFGRGVGVHCVQGLRIYSHGLNVGPRGR